MGIGVLLLIVILVVLASWLNKANSEIITRDYEEWKKKRR